MSGYCPDAYDQWVKLDEEQYERDQRRPRCADQGLMLMAAACGFGKIGTALVLM